MDITKYEVFLNVVDRGGLSRAAEDLGYTRSALSKIIGSMEKEIGFPLVKRTRQGIVLNEEGERVIPLIRQLVRINAVLEEEYSLIRGIACGKIRIGCFPTMAYLMMPDILKGFNEQYPGIQLEVVEENSLRQLETWLKQGIIDVAFFSREPYHEFDWIEIMEEPYVALIPEGHSLAGEKIIPVADLFDYKLILFKSHEGYDQDMIKIHDLIMGKKEMDYSTNSIYLVEKMVMENDCVSIVPLSMARDASKVYPVEYRDLDTEITRIMGFAVKDKAKVSPMVSKFLQYAKNI
ncbi:MAG: LysR family transcriptional regulator [Emergencia sp.]